MTRNYKLTYTWARGLYSTTRRYSNRANAIKAFKTYCDTLTDSVELYDGDTLLYNEGDYIDYLRGKKDIV